MAPPRSYSFSFCSPGRVATVPRRSRKGTLHSNGGQQRRVNCLHCKPLSQKPFSNRIPEMASAQRSYGNAGDALQATQNTSLTAGLSSSVENVGVKQEHSKF